MPRFVLVLAAALFCFANFSCSCSHSPDSIRIAFEAKEPADLWLNGAKVGPLPRTFELRELEPYFLPEFASNVESVQAMDRAVEAAVSDALGSAQSTTGFSDDFQSRSWKRAQDPDTVWLVRGMSKQGGEPKPIAGGFRVRVIAADGTPLESRGSTTRGALGVSTDTTTYGRAPTQAELDKLGRGASDK